jgi:3-oxoadipate enol-lactonase
VLFDARGHARSFAPLEAAAYTREHFIEDLRRLIDEVTADRVVVVGLSMGASIALELARHHSERLSGMILAAFPPGGPAATDWALAFADSIERDGLDAAGARFVWGGNRFDERSAELIRRGFLEHSPHALAHVLRALLATEPSVADRTRDLDALHVPALIVVGDRDVPSVAPSQALSAALPNATLLSIPDAGHVVNLEKAQVFSEATLNFLGRIEHGGRTAHA